MASPFFSRRISRFLSLGDRKAKGLKKRPKPAMELLGIEPLEDRIVMTLESVIDEVFPTSDRPNAVGVDQFNNDPWRDAVALGADGKLTIAFGTDHNEWSGRKTVDLGIGAVERRSILALDRRRG